MYRKKVLIGFYLATCLSFWLLLGFGMSGVDNDFFWHLRTGELILENHTWFYRDVFSWTFDGHPWFNHEWLVQVAYALVDRIGGYSALKAAHGLVVLAYLTVLLFLLRCGQVPIPLGLGLATVAGLCTDALFLPRPLAVSVGGVALCAWWLYGLQTNSPGTVSPRWLPLLFLVWANCHAGFAIGLAWIGMTLLGEYLQRFLPLSGELPMSQKTLRELIAMGTAGLAAGLVTPNGRTLYPQLARPLIDPQVRWMNSYLGEWQVPGWTDLPVTLALLYAGAMVSCCLVTFNRARWSLVLWVLVTVGAAAQSTRHLPFALIALTALGAHHLPACLEKGLPVQGWRRIATLLFVGAWISATSVVAGLESRINVAGDYPSARAVAFLQQLPPDRRLFNQYDWGGLFIYYLYPRHRVYIDGRHWTLYDAPHLQGYLQILKARGSWRRLLRQQNIDLIAVRPRDPIARAVLKEAGWKPWYRDPSIVVLGRRER